MASVAFCTLGCKVNQYETDAMSEQLARAGYEIRDFSEPADIYVVNTCTVTNIADRKSRQMLRRARKRNPQALIVAAGCYVDTSLRPDPDEGIADLYIGNKEKDRIALILQEAVGEKGDCGMDISGADGIYPQTQQGSRLRAYIKIQDGCNQFCSYCAIPLARGRVTSRSQEDIVGEARRLREAGYREIVLTGIHISSYGMDQEGVRSADQDQEYGPFAGDALIRLIEAIARETKDVRIRLGSLEPRIITEPFLIRLSALDQICPHFHLSLQSGCEQTLRRMNRHYTPALYLEKCSLLRRYFDDPAITTDVITGFPGETREEFDQTLDFVRQVGFADMHIFRYSRRDRTRAASMPGQVDPQVSADRSAQLIGEAARMRADFLQRRIGTRTEVLIEEAVDTDSGRMMTGHSRDYVQCLFSGQDLEPGTVVRGEIYKILKEDIAFCKEIH